MDDRSLSVAPTRTRPRTNTVCCARACPRLCRGQRFARKPLQGTSFEGHVDSDAKVQGLQNKAPACEVDEKPPTSEQDVSIGQENDTCASTSTVIMLFNTYKHSYLVQYIYKNKNYI